MGEWNTTRIVVNGSHVEHWLNGKKILAFERWTPEWNALRDSGKWKDAHTRQLVDAGVKSVVVIPDNDDPGRKHAISVAHSCATNREGPTTRSAISSKGSSKRTLCRATMPTS